MPPDPNDPRIKRDGTASQFLTSLARVIAQEQQRQSVSPQARIPTLATGTGTATPSVEALVSELNDLTAHMTKADIPRVNEIKKKIRDLSH